MARLRSAATPPPPAAARTAWLLPEEDAIGDPDEGDDEQDETLPADLWY